MKNNEAIVSQALHTADCDARMAEADAQFVQTFMSLKGEAQAARWRGLTTAEKSRLVVRRIEAIGKDWTPSIVAEFIAKYDAKFAAGPVDAAVEGALERLALESADHARAAESKADRTHFRRAATAYTNALTQYRNGVRPEVLSSGARLVPSSTPGKPAHLLTMDGDWVCSCCAGASMHWPIALVIGIEVAHDDMQAHDDGDVEPPTDSERMAAIWGLDPATTPGGEGTITERMARIWSNEPEPTPAELGRRLCEARSRYLEAA